MVLQAVGKASGQLSHPLLSTRDRGAGAARMFPVTESRTLTQRIYRRSRERRPFAGCSPTGLEQAQLGARRLTHSDRMHSANEEFQRVKMQGHLTRLVIAALAPAALAAAFLLGYSYQHQKKLVEENTLATARALMQAVDRQLNGGTYSLQVLATSPYLASADLDAFHRQARQALGGLPGNNIVLSDPAGQQLLNTLRDYGSPLPMHGNLPQLHRVIETGRPMVSDLFEGPVAGRPLIAIDVPVRRDGRVVYVLSLGFLTDQLGEILRGQHLPEGWVGAIFDSQGTVVARTHRADEYVGKKGAPALVRRIAEEDEGHVETTTLEGIPVQSAFSRSAVSNWSVAIGIPRAMFAAQLRFSMLWLASGTALLLALGIMLARLLANRVSRDIRGLIPPAAALARGEEVQVPRLNLDEADEVAQALVRASRIVRDREEILAVVTHDLRSPLNGIVTMAKVAELQAQTLPQGDGLRDSAVLIGDVARDMSGLVDDLLAVTVAQRGQSMLQMAPVRAGDVLARAVREARPRFERAGIALEVQAPEDLPQVQADPQRIVRVFRNLLDNALKFTMRPGRVVVGAQAHPACVRFFVANSGPPLPAEIMDRMFQVFWQAQDDRRGTGLGLSICRSIVDTHGGRIWAERQDGMRVRICVELHRADAEGTAERTPPCAEAMR